ncbi:type VI secretion system protein ImpG [Variovorax boronicumulans]|uniref:Type VI secretion system protein ImpG n=1 Tax=Variovorax boronicumulans TaxID=436515 RepID=A0AAW8E7A7_9BURK|nr:type VI secretion system baseplate subunit TssF [Variovorax boronicumulans]MDP9882212.1 type VI secretion system protein ImpG [Variovorax boronicumulans]MDP9920297.1 type VI secretion system protein ImpG [Variovorax boronicumulans]MDP9927459.1 type VI secretion system protein ImpG [Variovorax boronicumulans]
MDAKLLDYYNRELTYMHELGAEFAQRYPKIAGRLGMRGIEVSDPYVERLLEGFSFLTARIQLKMDAEFPRFSQRLLEVVYPNFLAPLPAMAVVQIDGNLNEGSLKAGYELPRHTLLRGRMIKGEQTACEFRTGHAVTLWPIKIADASLGPVPAEIAHALPMAARQAKSAITIKLEAVGGARFSEMPLDRLEFFLSGAELHALRVLELVAHHSVATVCRAGPGSTARIVPLGDEAIRHEGFDPEQSLLPYDARSFQGYRLLHEYFAFPERYLFFSVKHLRAAASAIGGTTMEIVILLDRADADLERLVDARHFSLFCTPIINLVPRRSDRIPVGPGQHEHHAVIDRTRPRDFEIFTVERVTGHMANGSEEREFRPFLGSFASDDGDFGAYFSLRREPRLVSDRARAQGTRTSYTGSEVYVSLVDQHDAPFPHSLRHITIDALCTNRDLPLLLPTGLESDFTLRVSAPVRGVRILRGPSRPYPALAEGALTWRLISHLGLNYLSLTDVDATQGAAALREMLDLYGNLADPAVRRQIQGVRSMALAPVFRRLPEPGPIVFGRGVEIALQIDEVAFSGTSPYLFGAVLEQFFSRHVSLNAFTEFALSSLQRGEIARWTPRVGRRPTV